MDNKEKFTNVKNVLIDEFKLIYTGAIENSKAYDKIIITLSSVFLGASITFLSNLKNASSASYIELIILSWLFWCFSIIYIIRTFWMSEKTIQMRLPLTYEQFERQECLGSKNDDESKLKKLKKLEDKTRRISRGAGMSFIFATICFMLFSILNIL